MIQGVAKMRIKKAFTPILVCVLLILACEYIVLPEEELSSSSGATGKGWSGVVTNVGKSETGDLHIDITIQNETGDWSAMKAVEGKPAILVSSGKTTNCGTVFVSSGGHRLAPGFHMRGYTGGTKAEPKSQMLYVECKGAEAAPKAKLTIEYIYYLGPLNYYHPEDNSATDTMELELDEVATDLTYPIATPIEGLIQPADVQITAISENVITLLDVQRIDAGLEFTWQNYNPTEFPLKVHIGNPPVIGEDGMIYGIFEVMDLASVPLTPAGGTTSWKTKQAVPSDVGGFYILLSVESRQMRLYVNYAIDITDK